MPEYDATAGSRRRTSRPSARGRASQDGDLLARAEPAVHDLVLESYAAKDSTSRRRPATGDRWRASSWRTRASPRRRRTPRSRRRTSRTGSRPAPWCAGVHLRRPPGEAARPCDHHPDGRAEPEHALRWSEPRRGRADAVPAREGSASAPGRQPVDVGRVLRPQPDAEACSQPQSASAADAVRPGLTPVMGMVNPANADGKLGDQVDGRR